ncbi:MAG: SAM-dependent methyltransferase [Burkholderiales bacterium]|nr:SAM-dependent methyltransferase [Burkholderiales bacterium]
MAEVVFTVNAPGGGSRAFRHRDTPADRGVVAQMFESQDYSFARLQRGPELYGWYEALVRAGSRPLILDAGANIGASAVFFALQFPRAHIVALEPAADNFALLAANAAGLDVDARRAAIGAREGEVALVDPGEGAWGYRTAPGAGVPVQAASQLLAEKIEAGYAPYLAKIDIEGGEGELFSRDTGWADRFPVLVIELHDWLLPRAGTSRSFLRWAAGLERDFVYVGENVFSLAHEWTGGRFHA